MSENEIVGNLKDNQGNVLPFTFLRYSVYKDIIYIVYHNEELDRYVISQTDEDGQDFKRILDGDLFDELVAVQRKESIQENKEQQQVLQNQKLTFNEQYYLEKKHDADFEKGLIECQKNHYDAAAKYFLKSASQGNEYAMTYYAFMIYKNKCSDYTHHAKKDTVALNYFRKAIDYGCPLALAGLAMVYEGSVVVSNNKDFAQEIMSYAFSTLEQLSGLGDFLASLILAQEYVKGRFCKKDDNKAFKYYELSMKQGSFEAGWMTGLLYISGYGCEENHEKGIKLLLEYPNPKSDAVQYELGCAFFDGTDVEMDKERGVFHLKNAAKMLNESALMQLGLFYQNGVGVDEDKKMAKEIFEYLVEKNDDIEAHYYLGTLQKNMAANPNEEEFKNGIDHLIKAANEGYLPAKYDMGKALISKEFEFSEDQEEIGLALISEAADGGINEAQNFLGNKYRFGYGREGEVAAYTWFSSSAEDEDPNGLAYFGECFRDGTGTKKNPVKALEYFKSAAEKGSVLGMRNLGDMYLNSTEIERDIQLGLKYLEKATEFNDGNAYLILAKSYFYGVNDFKGNELPIDYSKAEEYANKIINQDSSGYASFLLGKIYEKEEKFNDALAMYATAERLCNSNLIDQIRLGIARMIVKTQTYLDKVRDYLFYLENINFSRNDKAEIYYLLFLAFENGYAGSRDKDLARQYYNKALQYGYDVGNGQKPLSAEVKEQVKDTVVKGISSFFKKMK